MPTLADIYSAIDSAKRKGSDFIRNPGASLQQIAGYGMDRANAARDQLYEATEAEGIGYGPKTKALAQQMAGAYNPIGITTWHGSPHIFQKFDMSKLGTGEGAQVYGSGMYTAENPLVAKGYQESLAGKAFNLKPETERLGIDLPISARGEFMRQAQAKLPPERLAKNLQNANIDSRDLPIDKLTELFKTYQEKSGGNMYKVDLPDTHIRRMLDWDAPIKDQPVVVRNLAKSLGIDMNDLGGDLLAKVGKDEAGRKVMQDAGIRGVKYLDEKSRFSPHEVSIAVKGKPYASNQFLTKEQADKYAAEKKAEGFETAYKNVGTKNFVVFDPNHMTILERNNQAIK
jgi:hypothetical protein